MRPHVPSSSGPSSEVEKDPVSAASWETLLTKVRGQSDPLSIKTLEIILEGLRMIAKLQETAERTGTQPIRISGPSQAMFARLGKAYNSPTLLKEVGLVYLRELNLPGIALQHFERSLRLGGPEKELRPLTEAAAVAIQTNLTQESGLEQGYSGITTAHQVKPVAPNGLNQTGKLLLPAFSQTATLRLAGSPPAVDENPDELLPATTSECMDEARRAIARHHFRRAEILLEKADVDPPDNQRMWQAWTDLGQACYEFGAHAQVQTAFLKALRYGPKDMASHFNVALGLHLNEKYEEALASREHNA